MIVLWQLLLQRSIRRPLHKTICRPYLCKKLVSSSPVAFGTMADEFKLKSVTSLSLNPGDKLEVEVEGIDDAKVLLVNAGGKIQALGPKCTHYGAPLIKGVLTANGRLTCPWHGGMWLCRGICSLVRPAWLRSGAPLSPCVHTNSLPTYVRNQLLT